MAKLQRTKMHFDHAYSFEGTGTCAWAATLSNIEVVEGA